MGQANATTCAVSPETGLGRELCRAGGIWAVGFVFLAVLVDLRVFYEAGPWFPCFALDARFCLPVLRTPGGAAELADAFLAQWDFYGWPSAAALATAVTLLGMGVSRLAGQVLGGARPGWAYLTAGLALATFGRYGRHGAPLLGLTLAVGLAALQPSWQTLGRPGRVARFLVLGVLVYFLAGGPVIAFALLCAACEFSGPRRDEPVGAAILLAGCAIPLLAGVAGLGLPISSAFGRLLPMHASAQAEGLLPFCLLYAVLLGLCARAVLHRAGHRPAGTPTRPPRWRALTAWTQSHRRLAAALPPAGALVLLLAALDRPRHLELQLCRAARRGDWDSVLALAGRRPGREAVTEVVYCTNQALLHTGTLLESMFRFPQFSLGLTLGMAMDIRTMAELHQLRRMLAFDLGDSTLELGLVNEAEHEAFEVLTEVGPHPTVLRRLARIYAVKGNVPAVEHVLHALARDIVHAAQARAQLQQLRADPTSVETPEVLAIRQRRLALDVVDVGGDVLRRCELLLAADPRNRLAVDCLLGQYLIERDLAAVVRNLHRLRAAGYTALPRHVQEAVVLQEALLGRPVDLRGWSVDPDRRALYQSFAASLQSFRSTGDAAAARQALAPRFGESFFYYYALGRSRGTPE